MSPISYRPIVATTSTPSKASGGWWKTPSALDGVLAISSSYTSAHAGYSWCIKSDRFMRFTGSTFCLVLCGFCLQSCDSLASRTIGQRCLHSRSEPGPQAFRPSPGCGYPLTRWGSPRPHSIGLPGSPSI